MGLLDHARTEGAPRPKGPRCDVLTAMERHSDLADEIAAVIRDRNITQSGAERAFRSYGVHILKHTIGRHRDNECLNCRLAGVEW